jgi:hypothetical protein
MTQLQATLQTWARRAREACRARAERSEFWDEDTDFLLLVSLGMALRDGGA